MTFEGEAIAAPAWAAHRAEDYEERYPPHVRQAMLDEHERAREMEEADTTLMRKITAAGRRTRGVGDSAAVQMLAGLETPRAIRDGTEDAGLQRSNRDRLAELYTNLSDYARVAGERVASSGGDRAQARKIQERMDKAAVSLAQARGDVMDLADHFDRRLAGTRDAPSPLERAVARFQMVDPLVLGGLGLNPKVLAAAATGQDVDALLSVIDDINTRAKGQVQRWEAESGRVAESAQIRHEGGRGARPELPESDKPEVPDYEAVPGMTREQVRKARELETEMTTTPAVGNRGAQSRVATATAEDVGREWSYERDERTGKMVRRTGKVVENLSDEERAERKAEKEAEQDQLERIRGFLDPERGSEYGKRGGKTRQARPTIASIAKATKLSPARVQQVLTSIRKRNYAPDESIRADLDKIDAAIAARTGTRRPIPPAKTTRLTPELRQQIVRARQEERERGEEAMRSAEAQEVRATAARLKHRETHPTQDDIQERIDTQQERERAAAEAERERERQAEKEGAEAEKGEAEEGSASAERIQAEYEARGGNEEVAPELAKKSVELVTGTMSADRAVKARKRLLRFVNAVKAGRVEGDVLGLRAAARVIWDTRRTYRPPKGLYVHDPADHDNPFKYVRSVMPKVDPSQPGRQRYKPMRTDWKGRTIYFYKPTQVESTRGWRFASDFVEGPGGLMKRVGTGLKDFKKNENFFSPQKMDNLANEVMGQMNLGPRDALDVANIILDQESKRGQKGRSGTRGYEGGKRAPRRVFDNTEVPGEDEAVTVEVDDQGQIVEPEAEAEPTADGEEPRRELTPEEEQSIIDMLEGIKPMAGTVGTDAVESAINKLKGDIAALEVQIPEAEAVLPKMKSEIDKLVSENEEMTYRAPDGWPASPGWSGLWVTEEEGGDVVVYPGYDLDPFPGTDDHIHQRAIFDAVQATLAHQREQLELKRRRLDEIQSAWTEGAGGAGPGPGTPIEPTRVDFPPSPGGDSVVPGGEPDVGPGVSEGARAPSREAVDLFAHVSRKPFGADPVLNELGSPGYKGAVARRITPNPAQMAAAQAIVFSFKERMALLAKKGWEKSVNKSAALVMNGTGAGKSAVAAMTAYRMYDLQPGPTKKPVLIVYQDGLLDEIHNAFTDVGLEWDNGNYVFAPYRDLSTHKNKNYAAVVFDESHWIKNAAGKDYAASARELKTPFRVFLTATPTDAPNQEAYYLQYMNQDTDRPIELDEAARLIQLRLGVHEHMGKKAGESTKALGRPGLERYVKELDQVMQELVENNAAVSWTLPTISEGEVVNATLINPAAAKVAWSMPERMNEHLKVEHMVERTLQQLTNREGGKEWGVIAVFRFVEPAKSYPAGIPREFHQTAMDRYRAKLMVRAREQGIELRPYLLKGDDRSGLKMSQIAERFRDGTYNVLIMGADKGATGISLDDQSPDGMKPKLMLIAGSPIMGQAWIQLMGRVDRAGTTSQAKIEWIGLPESKTDLDMRNQIKQKVQIQRTVTGAKAADASKDSEFSLGAQLERDPYFRRRTPSVTPDYLSPVDRMVSEKLLAGPQSAAELVADIARNETDPALAAVARALQGHPALAGVTVNAGDPGALGAAEGRSIIVAPRQGAEAVTTLHEAAHHITHRAIDQNPVARVRLGQIMRAVPPTAAPGIEGVLTDPHEFVAEAFSNPSFQRTLQGIRLPRGNLWQRFKEFVRTLIGMRDANLTAWDAVMELRLTDPGTVTETGSGDVSTRLATTMYRRITPPAAVARAAEEVSDARDPAFRGLLKTLTFDQIVKSFGKIATDTTNGVKNNHLKNLYDLMDARYSFVTKERNEYSKRVLEPLRKWSVDRKGGRQMIAVQMEPGKSPVRMTRLQYMAEVMNVSGYAQVHFGKEATDPANSMLGAKPRKPGASPVPRTRTHEYWDLHKPQFDKLGQDGKDLYNDLADYFAEQIDLTGVMRSQQWLDTVAPRADGRSWFGVDPKDVRAEVKRLAKQSDEELVAQDIVRDSLEKLDAILDPGRVPGAYFPLKRFGEFIVTVDEREHFVDDEHREQLLKKYLGAKVDEKNQEIVYKAVSRFESQSDALAFRDRMRAEFPKANVSDVMVAADENIVERTGLSNTLIQQYESRIEKQDLTREQKDAQIKIFVQSMIDLMPEASYADTFRPRKGVLGASVDVQRSLHTYGSALSHYKGGALFSTQQRRANREFQKFIFSLENQPKRKPELDAIAGAQARKLRRIQGELAQREALVSTAFTENRWAQKANNVGFAYYLVSASYNILNALQPIMLTTPYLAGRFGSVATVNAMNRAYRLAGGAPLSKMIRTGFTVTKLKGLITGEDFDRSGYDILSKMEENLIEAGDRRHARLLRTLANRNMIEATVAMDMAQGAQRSHVDPRTGAARRQGKLEYLSEWMRMAPHITEVMNRSVTAIAAYDLEFARLTRKGVAAGEASTAATEYAASVINDTQFNYQNWNKPQLMQWNPLLRTVLMFKQHPQHIYYFMISRALRSSKGLWKQVRGEKLTPEEAAEASVARRQLAYFVGMHVLAAGAIGGTPEPIKWMIGLLNMIFGDDDEPFDFELWVQSSMQDWLGPELGKVGARGLPALAGVDLSSRIGINSMLLFEAPDPSSPDSFMADIFRTAGGPMISLFERGFYTAPGNLRDGDYVKALEALTPKAIRDPLRAWRTHAQGFTTYDGRVFSESDQVGPLELFLTSMGLNPTSTSEMYLSRTVESQVDKMSAKATALKKRAYHARGDREAFAAAKAEIRRWNQDNPAFAISMGDLVKSFKARDSNQAKTHAGMLVPDKYRPWAEERNRFRGIAPMPVTQE